MAKNATESIPCGAQNSARSGGVREEGGVDGRPRLKFPAVGPDYGAKGQEIQKNTTCPPQAGCPSAPDVMPGSSSLFLFYGAES